MRKSPALLAFTGTALLLASITGCAASPDRSEGEDPPGQSLSPAADVVYQCLVDKGWDVTITWDGGIEARSSDVPDAQVGRYEEDSAKCWAVIDERVAAYTPAQIAEVYDMELATRECLIEQGLSVAEPPSEQTYIDTFHGERWMAYGASDIDAVAGDQARWKEIATACPQPSWSLGAEG